MARYSDELLDEIKSKNDIIDIVSQYVRLKRSGRSFFGLCPFHSEKTPSFSVSPEKQIFHCFGCGQGGDVFSFVSKIENINYAEAIRLLAERAGIQLPTNTNSEDEKIAHLKSKMYEINDLAAEFYHQNLYKPTAKTGQDYVKFRHLDNNTLKLFKIGYSGTFNELYLYLKSKGYTEEEMLATGLIQKSQRNGTFYDSYRDRLMFPIMDTRNRVVGFGGRILAHDTKNKTEDGKPKRKYINSPSNLVYDKSRILFAMNIAKKYSQKEIIIVEGFMDVISLHQRGIHNVVASNGTALTEAQGRMLRQASEKIIIGYDADGAGQNATLRGLDILQNLGCDVRILQLDGAAKDPDEYIIKYGPERFQKCIDNAISLVEFKIKILKKTLNLENSNDKIKFLKEIAKVLQRTSNDLEREVYVDKIAKEYNISKESIYAEISKLENSSNYSKKILERSKPKLEIKEQIQENTQTEKRERLIIYLLINYPEKSYSKLKETITVNDIQNEQNRTIIKKLYEEFEKGNINTSSVLNWFENEEIINEISWILAYDFEVIDIEKCIEDIIKTYSKEKIILEKNEIIKFLEQGGITGEQRNELEARLNTIIIELAKMK